MPILVVNLEHHHHCNPADTCQDNGTSPSENARHDAIAVDPILWFRCNQMPSQPSLPWIVSKPPGLLSATLRHMPSPTFPMGASHVFGQPAPAGFPEVVDDTAWDFPLSREQDSSVGRHYDLGMVPEVTMDVKEALDNPNTKDMERSAKHISNSLNPASALE